jgi:low temperature requirement protein LtrA
MWWSYFDRAAEIAREHLQSHDDPVLAAADGYSYMHLAIVAGIIIFAVGAKQLVAEPIESSLSGAARLALCGGVALYLLGHAAFQLRLGGETEYDKIAVAVALMLLYSLGAGLPGWGTATVVFAMMTGLCATEIIRQWRRPPRTHLRHDSQGAERAAPDQAQAATAPHGKT